MTDVKTQPVKARFVHTEAEFWDDDMATLEPGLIYVTGKDTVGWYYSCPCGCGATGRLLVGENEKPATSPSWAWTGGYDAAVLRPSVHHVGHWHGWLGGSSGERPGWWVSC